MFTFDLAHQLIIFKGKNLYNIKDNINNIAMGWAGRRRKRRYITVSLDKNTRPHDNTPVITPNPPDQLYCHKNQLHPSDPQCTKATPLQAINHTFITQKSVHVTIALRHENSPSFTLNQVPIPQSSTNRYVGLTIDRRLTWRQNVKLKRTDLTRR